MKEDLSRLSAPKMEQYREYYKNSERWDGTQSLQDKTVIIYFEQGLGDAIQFSRYVSLLPCKYIFHCKTELFRLFEQLNPAQMIDKDSPDLPDHDYHILSMSMPLLLAGASKVSVPYLKMDEQEDLGDVANQFKIGIAWEGNPKHPNNKERCCPLHQFRRLESDKTALFMLSHKIQLPELISKECEDMPLLSSEMHDLYDTAKLINSMDVVASVDTSVMHLAAAMGKETYGLFSYNRDPRWEYYDWYPDLKQIRQKQENDWDSVFIELEKALRSHL